MNEFFKSLSEWFEEKTSSPFWYTLLFVFIGWNWQIFYTLFFEEIVGNTKIHYLCKEFFNVDKNFCPLIEWDKKKILYVYGIPLLISFIGIWAIPWLSNYIFKIRLEFEATREKDIDSAEIKLAAERRQRIMQEIATEETEREQAEFKAWEAEEKQQEEDKKKQKEREKTEWTAEYIKIKENYPDIKLTNSELRNQSSIHHKIFLKYNLINFNTIGEIQITTKGTFLTQFNSSK